MDRMSAAFQNLSVGRRDPTSSFDRILKSGDPALLEALQSIAPFRIETGLTRIETKASTRGGYGDIYRGELQTTEGGEVKQVAIKVLRYTANLDFHHLLTRLAREIRLWSSLKHPNVLELSGFEIRDNPEEATLVSPWMENGDLRTHINNNPYSRRRRLIFVLDTLDGLMYLHSRGVCHGDLKAANVLVTPKIRAVLCDFGVSRFTTPGQENLTTSNGFKGTRRWASPEQINSGTALLTRPADAWSWGMTALEVMTGEVPYHTFKFDFRAQYAISSGITPDPNDYPTLPSYDGLWNLFRSCWQQNPEQRAPLGDLRSQILILGTELEPSDPRRREQAMHVLELEIVRNREADSTASDVDVPRRKLATALAEYGRYLTEMGRHAEALKQHEEAVLLWNGLVARHPGTYELELAESVQQLSRCLAAVGRWNEALDRARKGDAMLQTLAEKDPDTYRPDRVVSLRVLSDRLADAGRRDEALKVVEEAVEMYAELTQELRASSQGYIVCLLSYSSRLQDLGRWDDALVQAQEAYDLAHALAEGASDQYRPTLASCLNGICACEAKKGKREEALDDSTRAVEIWRQLVEDDPPAFRPKLAASLTAYEEYLNFMGLLGDAYSIGREGVALWRALVDKEARSYSPDLSNALYQHSLSLSNFGRYEAALENIQEAVAIQERLAEEVPERFLPDLGKWCRMHAHCLKAIGALQKAIVAATQAVDILRPFAVRLPGAFRFEFSNALVTLSECLKEDGKPKDSLPYLRAAVDLDKGHAGTGSIERLAALAACLLKVGDNDEALRTSKEAVDMARSYAEDSQDAAGQYWLAWSLLTMSDCLMECGQSDEAILWGREVMDILERLALQQPKSFLPSYTSVSNSLIGHLRALGRNDEAISFGNRAADIQRQLSA